MSKRDIYKALRNGGMSRAGALGMMGNIGAESAFKADNVQDNCPVSDWDYTHNVNIGQIPMGEFASDGFGYGLCQWTYAPRKKALYEFAFMANESIGDEYMQCQFILQEMQTPEYQNLLRFLCETTDMYEAVIRVCREYERPAVNNIQARYEIACQCANEAYDDPDPDPPQESEPIDTGESCEICVRVLRQGMTGRDVFMAQTGINDMGCYCGIPDGIFGPLTRSGVIDLQRTCNLEETGIIGQDEWQIIFQ